MLRTSIRSIGIKPVVSSLLLKSSHQVNFYKSYHVLSQTSKLSPTQFIRNTPRIINVITSRRNYTVLEEEKPAEVIDYQKMKQLSEDAEIDNELIIIDVREPDEYEAGHIPHAVNLPCKSHPGALGLNEEDFKLRFGFDKPSTDKTLVFYCLGGVRSSIVEELAMTFGYNKRLNYIGSMEDWVANNGEITIPSSEK